MELRGAKMAVEGLLDGKSVRLQIGDEATAMKVRREIDETGAVCVVE
jgi:hypothetical protein